MLLSSFYIYMEESIIMEISKQQVLNDPEYKNFLLQKPTLSQASKDSYVVALKNFGSLIRAWERVTELHPDWSLEIWGDGEERQRLERRALVRELDSHFCSPVGERLKTTAVLHGVQHRCACLRGRRQYN